MRVIAPLDVSGDKCVFLDRCDHMNAMSAFLRSVGQVSGLAIRRNAMSIPFQEDVFTAHIYPILDASKRYALMFISDYTVAVRIKSSMTRHIATIYDPPPLVTWAAMVTAIYADTESCGLRNTMLRQLGRTNFSDLGLVRLYGNRKLAAREIVCFLRLRPTNVLNVRFVGIVAASMLFPKHLLKAIAEARMRYVFRLNAYLRMKGHRSSGSTTWDENVVSG